MSGAEKNIGPSGKERKSNVTDPQSAKMSTSHGVIQGYNGVAEVDERHQIVVHAEALGEGQENHLLEPMVKATRENFEAIGTKRDVFEKATLTAEAGPCVCECGTVQGATPKGATPQGAAPAQREHGAEVVHASGLSVRRK